MSKMSGMLDPGESALIIVAPHPPIDDVKSSLAKAPGEPEVLVVEVVPIE
jgi:hypothetical protein